MSQEASRKCCCHIPWAWSPRYVCFSTLVTWCIIQPDTHNSSCITDILIIPTCQRSDIDLVNIGHKVEDEKDRLLERVRLMTSTVWSSYECHADCFFLNSKLENIHVSFPLNRLAVVFSFPSIAVYGFCKESVWAGTRTRPLGRLYRPMQWPSHDP